MLTEIRYDQISRHRHSQDYLSSNLIMSKNRLFYAGCDVLPIVCFKAKLRCFFFYVKQLSRIDF